MNTSLDVTQSSENSLINLVEKRFLELEADIKRLTKNGSHATLRHYEKQRNENIEILFRLKSGYDR